MKQFTTPSVLTTIVANALVAVGGAIGWFTVSSTLAAADAATGSTLQANLNAKKGTAIVLAIVCILITMVVAKWQKRWIQVLPLLLDAFLVLVTANQLSGRETATNLGLQYSVGYWLSLVGAIVATVGCVWIIATVKKSNQTA